MKLPEINSERWMSLEDLPGEEWAAIPGHKDAYRISTMGRAKCVGYFMKRGGERPYNKKPFIKVAKDNGHGYYTIVIDGHHYYLHRLVAQAFVPNLWGYPEIDHINGLKDDNRAQNLRWATRKMNMANKLTRIKSEANFEEMKRPILQIDLFGKVVKEWPSATDASAELGTARSVITGILSNKRKGKVFNKTTFVYKDEYDPHKDYRVVYKCGAKERVGAIGETSIVNVIDGVVVALFFSSVPCGRYYHVSYSAIRNSILRNKKGPNKWDRDTRVIPKTLMLFRDLSNEQREYVFEHFNELLIRAT